VEGLGVSVHLMSVYRREGSLIGCNAVEHLQDELAEELRGMAESFESGKLVLLKEGKLTLITLEKAVEAYATRGKMSVITFE